MKRKKIWALGAVLCLGMQLLACGKRQTAGEEKIHVGVTYYNQSDTFLNQLILCLRERFEEMEQEGFEITITVRDAAGSQKTQDDQVKELLDAGCNVLCVNLVDRADPSEIIDLARENDVPIIFFNREPVAGDMMQWDGLYYV
ncbi:MAG: substrate-binding domain-containing protein, partial [Lachnospiraceae bacterium]|nr:substrate-binding domain-containing protein [Lachnospiraceae bacterium]